MTCGAGGRSSPPGPGAGSPHRSTSCRNDRLASKPVTRWLRTAGMSASMGSPVDGQPQALRLAVEVEHEGVRRGEAGPLVEGAQGGRRLLERPRRAGAPCLDLQTVAEMIDLEGGGPGGRP